MKIKWGLIVILVSVLALLVADGCREKQSQELEILPPLPRYLSREHEDSKPVEGQATTEATRQEQAASSGQPVKTPEEVAEQISDLEKVLARRSEEEGGREARIALEVPMRADQPIRRIEHGRPKRTPPTETGKVALTSIKPIGAGSQSAEQPEMPVPIPPSSEGWPRPPEQTATAAGPEGKAEQVSGPVTLETLTKRYEAMARSAPGDVEVGRTLRFLYFLGGEDEKGLEAIGGLTASQQKLWRDLMWTLIVARDRMPGVSRADHAAEVLDALEEVRNGLRKEAPLELGEVRFCEKILRFGIYTPVAINHFRPKQEVLLYSEVRNFISTKESDGWYHVRLSQRLSLENSTGTEVWRHVFENIHDRCRSLRGDFFLGTTIPLPGDLQPGKYVLKVAVEDITTSKSVGARLELEIIRADVGH